ncbi:MULTISPECIES: ABC transporter ATP-binding protein [Paraburkholderia]|uniref:ABC transporter ATP-binding protein n=1 Tax=Paraburkholderia largidicola TaxID=3014751 RepID=A0A7I8BZV5_9BURK|nr:MULTISPECIES: ABC transporter ATP-binding protein [Paraburkholderia]BEU27630.1 ABC transporter ATP-binding protein [Paraburkholderia sp. 22B1P]GJH34073.1 ATP-binding cassette domain-containing protein [Paraburkholderia hospita]CAG9271513.1 Iron complex transport system ATP-binding protein [Paraburkholderia caribensis]BCF94337.1 ABC transporter ATP-binding protein [Paraburkholderia sp. PGU16]GJH04311.1 ATP-binding cassette domain-containing protein [Paraburkholderia terrae]
MNGLSIHGLSVQYGKRAVLKSLDAGPLPRGQITALLGPNGSGKSTLLRALAGLTRAHAGQLTLDGTPLELSAASARSHSVVYLPQSLPAGVKLQVLESVLVACCATRGAFRAHGARTDDLANARAVLERLGIDALASRSLDELSGGQRQLVGIAQALVREPQVLLLDEPLSALDLNYQFHVMRVLRDITRERGIVTVVVLHDINTAMRACHQAMLLHAGRIAGFGPCADVVTQASLAEVFGVTARIESCSRGQHQVLIDGLSVQDGIASR